MSTTVKSSELDFNNIKNRLKDYLKKQSEFDDYDFEASGLSNILDVLAYNTHLNALSANFALNESFLASAQLRSSVVSHAETLGYDVRSVTASRALVNLSVNLSGVIGRSSSVILPAGTTFSSQIDGTTYTFNTIEAYVGDDNGSGIYNFYTKSGSFDIPIYEGINKVKNFIVGDKAERQVYVVPDVNIDKQTAVVRVFDTASSSNFINYNDIKTAVNVDANSTLYTIRETPNGFYEMNFGDGISFGKSPDPGNKIELTYLSTKGLEGNSAKVFTPTVTLSVNGANYAI